MSSRLLSKQQFSQKGSFKSFEETRLGIFITAYKEALIAQINLFCRLSFLFDRMRSDSPKTFNGLS